MNKSESIKELAVAFNRAQAKMRGAIKDANNPFFKSKYADLESIWEAVKIPLLENGLSVSQLTGQTPGGDPVIETLLMHNSGEWIMGQFPLIAKDASAQAMGSAVSYARRYALAALCSLPQIDDDGEAAAARDKPSYAPTKKTENFVISSSMGAVIPTNRNKDAKGNNYISEKQMWRFFAIAKKHGFPTPQEANAWLKATFHIERASEILANQYDLIVGRIEQIKLPSAPPPISDDDLPF